VEVPEGVAHSDMDQSPGKTLSASLLSDTNRGYRLWHQAMGIGRAFRDKESGFF